MFCSCQKDAGIQSANAYIESVNINGVSVANGGSIFGISVDSIVIHVIFSTIPVAIECGFISRAE